MIRKIIRGLFFADWGTTPISQPTDKFKIVETQCGKKIFHTPYQWMIGADGNGFWVEIPVNYEFCDMLAGLSKPVSLLLAESAIKEKRDRLRPSPTVVVLREIPA